MQGRLERDLNLQRKIHDRLTGKPDYLTQWYYYLKSSDISETTCYDYITKMIYFFDSIGTYDIITISLIQITKYMASIKTKTVNGNIEYTSDSYKQCVWSCLNNFFNFAVINGYVKQNFMSSIKRSRNNDLPRINRTRIELKSTDYTRIIKAVNNGEHNYPLLEHRDILIILLLMTTGMRKSALLQININDIDIDNGKLFVIDKGNKKSEYAIKGDVMLHLNEWLADRLALLNGIDSDALFISINKKRMSASALDKLVNRYSMAGIGKHLSPHKFRSGFCSMVYKKTGDIELTRRAVGHSNISTTQRYIATNNKERETATDIMMSIVNK